MQRYYYERRGLPRMSVSCDARYRVDGEAQRSSAEVLDLSGSGLLLEGERELPVGSRLFVEIRPGTPLTPPLHLLAEVLRCEPDAEGVHRLACAIDEQLLADEIPPDFP
ncbi:MAG TPA: PilZ domain-containing protein [Sedimenticola sp.]|nr:PilZ domain-containing protein [Sedimenticola sp.]